MFLEKNSTKIIPHHQTKLVLVLSNSVVECRLTTTIFLDSGYGINPKVKKRIALKERQLLNKIIRYHCLINDFHFHCFRHS